MPARRAIYPGTFDPITNGHLDIIRRALRLFDELVVAVAANPQKEPFLQLAEREELVRHAVRNFRRVRITTFRGLLVDLASEMKAVAIVRGLRAVSDFELEFQMALANRKMHPATESVFLMPSAEHTFISSTIIKNIAMHGGRVRPFVPAHVERLLQRKLKDSTRSEPVRRRTRPRRNRAT